MHTCTHSTLNYIRRRCLHVTGGEKTFFFFFFFFLILTQVGEMRCAERKTDEKKLSYKDPDLDTRDKTVCCKKYAKMIQEDVIIVEEETVHIIVV